MNQNVESMSKMIWFKTYSPEYFINELGEVRTFDRCEYMPYKNSVRKVHRRGKILKSIKMSNGYYVIDIANKGRVKRIAIHRLMAQVFLKEKIEGKHIHHIDGNKKNNLISNLEIVDPKLHCREHCFERKFKNKTGYRGVHQCDKNRYRGSIQRSGKKTIYTKIYGTPEEAYNELQLILKGED